MSSAALSPLTPDEHAIVARVVDDAPPITEAAKARLAALLRPAGARDRFADALTGIIRGGAS